MTEAAHTKRAVCAKCLRPQRTCICRWIAPIAHAAEVLVLQHPMETGQAKGSARLLHLSLPHSRLAIGEVFPEEDLRTLLHAPFDEGRPVAMQPRQAVLLYPNTPSDESIGMPAPPALEPALLREPAQLRLIVLDGTWRKSRKMLYLNPKLQILPRLALQDVPATHYRIRKAHGPNQLSTLEAVCYALMQLERDDTKYRPLLAAFDGFVAQQAGYRSLRSTASP